MLSISSSTAFTRSGMLASVKMLERIFSTTHSSKRRALILGASQDPFPRFMRVWQT